MTQTMKSWYKRIDDLLDEKEFDLDGKSISKASACSLDVEMPISGELTSMECQYRFHYDNMRHFDGGGVDELEY